MIGLDKITIENLYRKVGRAAISKTMRIVGRKDIAEEILQEVFLRLWQKSLKFDSEKAAYFWIYKSCHNAAIDYLRSAVARREQGGQDLVIEMQPSENDQTDQFVNRELILRAISRLNEREAAVLLYREIDGLTQDEIAEIMDVSRKTIGRTITALEANLSVWRKEVGSEFRQ